jgi:hypothetical protein
MPGGHFGEKKLSSLPGLKIRIVQALSSARKFLAVHRPIPLLEYPFE